MKPTKKFKMRWYLLAKNQIARPDCSFLPVQHANASKPAQLAHECALCAEHIGKQKLHACGLFLELAFCKNLWFLIR